MSFSLALQVSLNDSHNQMVVHWAGEKSNVIVALARDSLSLLGPKNSDVSNTPWPCPGAPSASGPGKVMVAAELQPDLLLCPDKQKKAHEFGFRGTKKINILCCPMGSREISNLSPPCSLLNFHQIFQKGAQNFVLLTPLQVYVSYDYGKSFKKISERFSFDGGNSSEVAIAQFYHSPADNKRVRGTWQLGLYPCCHREPGHPLGCPWGRGGTCQALLVRLGDAQSVAGEGWLAQPNSSPPEFALPKAPLGCAPSLLPA